VDLKLEQMEGLAGRAFLAMPEDSMAQRFPSASRWVGALTCISRIAGMECPGRYSMISAIKLEMDAGPAASGLSWEISRVDDRVRRVDIDVAGMGVRGQCQAFALQPPAPQASMEEIAGLVASGEFAGQRALVVGGSRGLGELTAKVIAAGGGIPVITYAVGKDDAERVAEEIRAFGSACETLQYDARREAELSPGEQLAGLTAPVSTLYYYATKRIAPTSGVGFDRAAFDEYVDFYVAGFEAVWKATRPVCAFYPSTVYVDERPAGLTEYAMAKAAGEVMCADLEVIVERLPRLPTDQTVTIVPEESGDSLEILLPIIRKVQWRLATP
jgi:hypothetical protein